MGKLIRGVLYATWVAFVVLTPLLGVWLASSLVAFHGGPAQLALVGGALLFPVLPVAWEIRATQSWNAKLKRRKQLVGTPQRSFTLLTRLVARTLFLNLAFLAVLAVWFPKVAFPAVATRGDWFLDGKAGAGVELARRDLHEAAAGLEWLYDLAHQNPYKKQGDDAPVPDSVVPLPEQPTARRWIPPEHPDHPEQPQPKPEPQEDWKVGSTTWPWKATPADLAYVDERSLLTVGQSIAAHETDPFKRVKALHDWVVTRYRYDTQALQTLSIPPQDAESVFQKRVAVCEGYARTLVALGKVTGDEIVYLVGDVREESGSVAPIGHAWNAAKVNGAWYLVDATWDDPVMADGSQAYQTDYLFIPPSLAIYDHFPDQPKWQLLEHALTRGDFLRQPLARPGLAREGLKLVTPERSTVEVDGPLEVALDNPRHKFVMVTATPEAGGSEERCGVSNDEKLRFRCELPARQVFNVRLYQNDKEEGVYGSMAVIRATRK